MLTYLLCLFINSFRYVVSEHVWRLETASGKQFSLPTVRALGTNLRSPGLVARPLFTDLSHQFYAHTSGKHQKKNEREGRKKRREFGERKGETGSPDGQGPAKKGLGPHGKTLSS